MMRENQDLYFSRSSSNVEDLHLHPHDVITGRGNEIPAYPHEGNENFRSLVQKYKNQYHASRISVKALIVNSIVMSIMDRNPPGRFLKKDENTGQWFDIGYNEAVTKTRQAFGEGTALLSMAPQAEIPKRPMQEMNPAAFPNRFSTSVNTIDHFMGEQDFSIPSAPLFHLHYNKNSDFSAPVNHRRIGRQQQPLPSFQTESLPLRPTSLADNDTLSELKHRHSPDVKLSKWQDNRDTIVEPQPCNPKENETLTQIKEPHPHDVISGRSNDTISHLGNIHYRFLVKRYKVEYVSSPKDKKPAFAKIIVDLIQSKNPPGRFLKLDNRSRLWTVIGYKQALIKTRQALREGAPLIKKQVMERFHQKQEPKGKKREKPQRVIDPRTLDAMNALLYLKSAG